MVSITLTAGGGLKDSVNPVATQGFDSFNNPHGWWWVERKIPN
ncbi:hypothetical protein FDUTEX481_03014 [Tolypothrix sp. PCC 7601]|nr:hypothetical protein FDUTEX481_03014 [Tolypothrix sp. PCC 7601]